MSNDKLVEFEESGFDWLIDKFLEEKEVADLWAEFVYNEYVNSTKEPDDMEDR